MGVRGIDKFVWTGERVQLLRHFIADRYSAREAASEFGVSLSCVGRKARRLGLSFNGVREAEWPDARVDRLKQLWAQDLSGSAIALRLGDGLTRSAVLGQARKLGLERRVVPRPRTRTEKAVGGNTVLRVRAKSAKGQLSGIVHRANRARRDDDAEPIALPRELPAEAVPMAQRKQLVELEQHHCRYPFGTPGVDLFFCGADALSGKPYCPSHFALCCPGMVGASAVERQQARVAAKRAAQDAGTTARIF